MLHYLPFLSTVVTLIFTGAVLGRFLERRRLYLLYWGIGLLFYGLGTLGEVVLAFGFNAGVMKLWYLSGAMLTAAWLGQGTIQLLVRKRGVATAMALALLAVSVLSAFLVFTAPVQAGPAAAYDVNQPASAQYHDILVRSGGMIFLTVFLNIYGTLGLVGGALYSAFIFWRKRVLANRMYGNILIAAGGLLPAMGGTFLKAGLPDWLYLSELLGSVLMFLGFLVATSASAEKSPGG